MSLNDVEGGRLSLLLSQWVSNIRQSLPSLRQFATHVIERHDIPLAHTRDIITRILSQRKRNVDLVHRMPAYSMVIFSKFAWLQEAMRQHPTITSWIWVDAGQSRNYKRLSSLGSSIWPHPSWTEALMKDDKDKIWIQGRIEVPDFLKDTMSKKYAIGSCESVLWATIFAGNSAVMSKLCERVLNFFFNELLKKNRIDTEQVALQELWKAGDIPFQILIPSHFKNLWGLHQYSELGYWWHFPRANPNQPFLTDPSN